MSVGAKHQAEEAVKRLSGAKIHGAALSPEDSFGDTHWGLEVETADGRNLVVWVLRDEEGNGPGALDYQEV